MSSNRKSDKEIIDAYTKELPEWNKAITLEAYSPDWPNLFKVEKEKIIRALGKKAIVVEHVGSTAVPNLSAKPKIDILLVVVDSSNESEYAPYLEKAGYSLEIRERDWYEHRMFRGIKPEVNLHVFSLGCVEIDRMIVFRDRLRNNESERLLYERKKKALAKKKWKYVQNYADAKSKIVEAIISRAK